MQLLYTIQVNGNSVEINNSIQTFAYPINTVSTTKIDENNFYLYAQNRNIPFIIDWRNVTIPDYNNYVDIDAFLLDLNTIINTGNGGSTTIYKKYVALLNQTGLNAPVATVLEDDFGNITFEYATLGSYKVLCDNNDFVNNKTVFLWDDKNQNADYLSAPTFERITDQEYRIHIGSPTNGYLRNNYLEIRVYP